MMRICLSISDYHPESWSPIWNTETILKALISFMNSDEMTVGAIISDDSEKKKLAA